MSFEINWDQLVADDHISLSIKQFLDNQFKSVQLPSFVSNLSVSDFSLGAVPPEITIRHIGDPFDEFYKDEDEEDTGPNPGLNGEYSSSSDDDNVNEEDEEENEPLTLDHRPTKKGPLSKINPIPPIRPHRSDSLPILHLGQQPSIGLHVMGPGGGDAVDPYSQLHRPYMRPTPQTFNMVKSKDDAPQVVEKSDNDIQFIMEFKYQGDVHIEIEVDLLVNYPLPNFISLPIKLHITDMVIHSIMAIAYLKDAVFLSFLCDVNDTDMFNNDSGFNGGNFVDYASFSASPRERIDIIKRIKIELEIGEVEHNVLRNVGKVERFLVEQLREILRDEVAWPSWICFDVSKGEEEASVASE